MDKVSIVIPLYNVASYIEACCDSVARQDYGEMEVVFVDDCSTDSTMTLLGEYLERRPDFPEHKIVHHEHNRGLSAARNSGLDASEGRYVLFLDSDDELTAGAVSALMAEAQRGGYDVVVGSVDEVDQSGATLGGCHLATGAVDDALAAYAEGVWYVMAWNKLCRRDFLTEKGLRFEEGLLHEDVVWSFKLACSRPKMYLTDRVTYIYRVRGASIMTSMSIARDAGIYADAFAHISKFIDEKSLGDDRHVYAMTEGKKSGILYSLLQKGEGRVYAECYRRFHESHYVSPWKAWRRGIIGAGYLLRDLGYCMPPAVGAVYKKLFYIFAYRLRGKQIEGAVWK